MNCITIAKYLRISSEDEGVRQDGKDESNSIANQRNLLTDFISRVPEFEDADVLEFCDDGWSGKNFERPAVKEMLKQVKQGAIQCIVVKDLSRFGRDYLTVGNYISRVFPFMEVRFIAVNDGFDSIRPTDTDSLETSFKTLLYDLYSRDISHKVRNAKQFRAQRGDFLSPFAPYGYVKDKGNKNQLVIDPEAAKIVRRIFQMAADRWSAMQIARTLNSDQVPTPMQYKRAAGCSRTVWQCIHEDNFWTNHTVTKILRDERYLGKTIYGKQMRDEVGKAHVVKNGRTGWITVEDTHEGIVTQEEFNRAQDGLREFTERGALFPGSKGNMLYKKVRCGICGHIMTRVKAKQPYYICTTPRVTSAYPCMEERMPESDLQKNILDGLRIQTLYAVETSRIREEEHRRKICDVEILKKTISGLKENRAGLESYIPELYERYVQGELDKEGYLAAKAVTVKKRDAVSNEIEKLETELKHISADTSRKNKHADGLSEYIRIKELTAGIMPDVLEEIIVYPDNRLHIIWNYQEDLKQVLLI